MDTIELVRRAKAGDRRAFDELIRQYRALLVRIATSILHTTSEAEDVVQDACLRAWRALPRFREGPESGFQSWIARIATNCALTDLRDRRRATAARERLYAEAARPHTPEVCASLMARELLECLPPDFRETLALYAGAGLSYQEIALALGIARGTVMSRLSRARARLAHEIALPSERTGAFLT